jgi:hypothetical protein
MSSIQDLPITPNDCGDDFIIGEYLKERDTISTIQDLKDHVHRWRHLWNIGTSQTKNEYNLYNESFELREAFACFTQMKHAGSCEHVDNGASCYGAHITMPYLFLQASLAADKFGVPADIALIQLNRAIEEVMKPAKTETLEQPF